MDDSVNIFFQFLFRNFHWVIPSGSGMVAWRMVVTDGKYDFEIGSK